MNDSVEQAAKELHDDLCFKPPEMWLDTIRCHMDDLWQRAQNAERDRLRDRGML